MAKAADFYGLSEDAILTRIEDGESITSIATSVQCSKSMLSRWLRADEERSARASDARISAAAAWDERAEAEIQGAADPFQLAKAKEMAHHLRWRASKISPKVYGERLQQDINVKREPMDMSLDEILAELAQIESPAGRSGDKTRPAKPGSVH